LLALWFRNANLDALSFPHPNGTFVYQFDPLTGGYRVNDFIGGWEGDDNGVAPTVKVGESFFTFIPIGKSTNWVRAFNVGP